MRKALAVMAGMLLAGGASVKTANAMIASEEYNWYGTVAVPPNDASDSGGPVCGAGTKSVCDTVTTRTCNAWHNVSAGGGVSEKGANVDVTIVCSQEVVKVVTRYYP